MIPRAGKFTYFVTSAFIFAAFLTFSSLQLSVLKAENLAEVKDLKVAAAQILTGYDLESNRAKIIAMIKEAAESGCRVILFHEGCLTGYPDGEQLEKTDFARVREIESEIRDLAARYEVAILLGSSGRKDGCFTNYVLVIDETGKALGKYNKTWRAGEPYYQAGSGPVIFTVSGVEATVIICHDLRYPELPRLAVASGARIVFIANNESGILREDKLSGYRAMQISRATENLVFSVMSNAPADPLDPARRNASHGNSKITDPLGNVLEEAGVFEEKLVTADLKLEEASRSPVTRTTGQNEGIRKQYGTAIENPEYTDWITAGLKMVRRLDGSDVDPYLKN